MQLVVKAPKYVYVATSLAEFKTNTNITSFCLSSLTVSALILSSKTQTYVLLDIEN